MFKRFMNILTLLSVLWGVCFIIAATVGFVIEESPQYGEFFEWLIFTIFVYFLIGILNYLFFNKITLWHKQPKN